MFAKKKQLMLMVTLLIMFTLAFSTVAQAAEFYSLSASPQTSYAYPETNYRVNYDLSFGTDQSGYYLMEVWHDGHLQMTFLNMQNGWSAYQTPDYWNAESAGWHTAYFRVYKQAAYNSTTKASGLLVDNAVSVYRYN